MGYQVRFCLKQQIKDPPLLNSLTVRKLKHSHSVEVEILTQPSFLLITKQSMAATQHRGLKHEHANECNTNPDCNYVKS